MNNKIHKSFSYLNNFTVHCLKLTKEKYEDSFLSLKDGDWLDTIISSNHLFRISLQVKT